MGAALLLRFNHGNVAILWPPYRIDMSVNFALAASVVLFLAGHFALIGIARALDLPQRVREYQERRQLNLSLLALRDAVLAYLEGRMSRVERAAQNAAQHPLCSAPAALLAARSAQRLQEFARRDRWLQAAGADPQAVAALWMTQAELSVEDQRSEEAVHWIEKVHARGVRHMTSLRVALRAYEQAERWDDVLRTLRLIEKRGALHPAAVRRLRLKAYAEILARKRGDTVSLRELWRSLRAEERAMPELIALTAEALIEVAANEDARRMLEERLDIKFSDSLVAVYAQLPAPALRDRLGRLEGWRYRYGDEPSLLLALGRVCAAEKLWGKAEEYLRLAVAREPSVMGYAALGDLFESLERPTDAERQFRLAVRLATA